MNSRPHGAFFKSWIQHSEKKGDLGMGEVIVILLTINVVLLPPNERKVIHDCN